MINLAWHLLDRFKGICTYCGHDCCTEICVMSDARDILVKMLDRIDRFASRSCKNLLMCVKNQQYDVVRSGSWLTSVGQVTVKPNTPEVICLNEYTVDIYLTSSWGDNKDAITTSLKLIGGVGGKSADEITICFRGNPDRATMRQILESFKYFESRMRRRPS
jgi:hypothetical protein